jgi:hypothetical protein
MKRVIRSDKPDTLLLLFWSHKSDFGAEPRSRIIATSAVKGLKLFSFAIYAFIISVQLGLTKWNNFNMEKLICLTSTLQHCCEVLFYLLSKSVLHRQEMKWALSYRAHIHLKNAHGAGDIYTSKCVEAVPAEDSNPGCRRANTLLSSPG